MTKKISVHPTGWRVLLKPVKVKAKTRGGIILPDSVQEIEQMTSVICEVIEMGEKAFGEDRHGSAWFNEGDYVLIERSSGMKFDFEGEEYRILDDEKIVAKADGPEGITIK